MQRYVIKKNDHIWDNEQETLVFKGEKYMIAIVDYDCYQNSKVPVKSRVLRYDNCYIF